MALRNTTLALIAGSFILSTCSKVDINSVSNLNNGKIDIIGHAGSGFQSLINPYPSNSSISIRQAIDGLNADGVEIDIEISLDSIPVVYHDVTLEQNTNCVGCVSQKKASEVTGCQFYNNYGTQIFRDEKIILLSDLINHFADHKKLPQIYLNAKTSEHCTDLSTKAYQDLWTQVMSDFIKERNAYNWISLVSADVEFMKALKELNPQINLIMEVQSFEEGMTKCKEIGFGSMLISRRDISVEQTAMAHAENIKVVVWDVHTREEAIQAIKRNPDAILTDNIPLVQEIIRK